MELTDTCISWAIFTHTPYQNDKENIKSQLRFRELEGTVARDEFVNFL
jgi:hypothetical protein